MTITVESAQPSPAYVPVSVLPRKKRGCIRRASSISAWTASAVGRGHFSPVFGSHSFDDLDDLIDVHGAHWRIKGEQDVPTGLSGCQQHAMRQ